MEQIIFETEHEAKWYVEAMRAKGWLLSDPIWHRQPDKKLAWKVIITRK